MNDDGGSYLYQRSGETATAFAAQLSEPSIIRFLFGGDDEEETYDPWKQHNWDVISTIPHFTGMLSLLGSGWIISKVLSDAKRREHVYHRIMLVLSTFDFFLSFWMFMAKWAHPTNQGVSKWNDPDCPQCHGTVGTCEASGFFIMLGTIAIPLYNVALSVYYYLVICKGWKEEALKSSFEKYVHVAIITSSLVLALIPIPLELYNPYNFFCYVSATNLDPETNTFERGTLRGTRFYLFFSFGLIVVSALLVAIILVRIYFKVKQVEKRSSMYEEASTNQRRPSIKKQASRNLRSSNARSRSNAVAIRALLYTVPFYLTWIIPSSYFLIAHMCFSQMIETCFLGPRSTYVLQVWTAVFMPLQGFFNAIIYDAIPYFLKRRRKKAGSTELSTESVKETPRRLSGQFKKLSGSFKKMIPNLFPDNASGDISSPDSNESNTLDLVLGHESGPMSTNENNFPCHNEDDGGKDEQEFEKGWGGGTV